MPDARPIDARPIDGATSIDAAPPAPDARPPDAAPPPPDATPPIDATPGPDADTTPDATPCVSDDECDAAGSTCNEDGAQITCEEVQTGCFQVSDDEPVECGANQACVADEGCVCNANENCEAAGEFCTDDGVLTCTEDEDGCLINEAPVPCAAPTVCDPDEGGEGHAECVCPAVGFEPGEGCQGTAVNTITCSADDSDVVRCDVVGEAQCQVWVSLDDCADDGLECNDNDCVCPDVTDTNEFFADPVVDRSERPPETITPTGARNPAICSFEEMSTAIAFAIDASGPGNIFDTFAVASNDTDPGTPAVFRQEALPWPKIPDNVTVTNTGSADVGGPGILAPELWIIEVNSHEQSNIADGQHPNASVHLSGRVNRNVVGSRGGAIQGLTFVRGPCRFDLESTDCDLPETAIYMDGYSNVVNTAGDVVVDDSLEARIYSVNILGHGGESALTCPDDDDATTDDRFQTGGTFQGSAGGDTFIFEAPADVAGCANGVFSGVVPGDWFAIDSGPNAGAYKVVDTIAFSDLHGGTNDAIVALELLGVGVDGDATGTWTVFEQYSGSDSAAGGTNGEWRFGFVANGNGFVYDLQVAGFESALSGCNNDFTMARAGVMVVGNFDDDDRDEVVFSKPNLNDNDIGFLVESGVSRVEAAAGGDFPGGQGTISGNRIAGVMVEEGVTSVSDIRIDLTEGSGFGNDCNLGSGNGIRLLNYGNSTAAFTGVVSTQNSERGAYVGNFEGCERGLICFNDGGWDATGRDGDVEEFTGSGGNCEFNPGGNDNSGPTQGPNVIFTENGFIDFSNTELSENFESGLHVRDWGVVEVNGGEISRNGEQGIDVDGCSIVNTNSGAGGDSDRLSLADNGHEGIGVREGEVNATATDVTGNGTANRCDSIDEEADDDAASPGIWVRREGTFHGVDLLVENNRGAGVAIETGGEENDESMINNYEIDPCAVWPDVDEDACEDGVEPAEVASRGNTLEDTLVTGNDGALSLTFDDETGEYDGDCFDSEVTNRLTHWPVAGVHVDDNGDLHFVNSDGSDARDNVNEIIANDKYGLWLSGNVDRFAGERDLNDGSETSAVVNINDNGWTGVVVDTRNSAQLDLEGGTVNNNGRGAGAATGGNDGIVVHGGIVVVVTTTIDNNADDGFVADALPNDDFNAIDEYAASNTEITLTNITVTNNDDDGLFLHGAPGQLGAVEFMNQANTMMAVDPRLDPTRGFNNFNGPFSNPYGIIINGTDAGARPCSTVVNQPGACIHSNGGDGIDIGVSDQDINVTVFMDLGEVFANGGNGIRMEQNGDFEPGDTRCTNDEGIDEEGDEVGCSGATIHGAIVHDNADSGFEYETAFVIPRRIGNIFYGMGWTSNKSFHNAIGAGCSAPQSQPQVMMRGPTAQDPAVCDQFDIAGNPELSETLCEESSDDSNDTNVNFHCYWTGSTCIGIWDMRGALDCDDNTANPNQIHSYNTNTDPVGSSELSVGMYAQVSAAAGTAGQGADVWADNNSWRTGDEAQNTDQDASSFIDADTICPAGGILLQCSSQ